MKITLASDNQSLTIVEPRETSLDTPSLGIARNGKAWRLSAFSAPLVSSGRNAGFYAARRQLMPESGTIKAFIGNQLIHSGSASSAPLFFDGDGCQGAGRRADFVRLRALAEQANWQTVAISDEHYFVSFSGFSSPNSIAPFLDGTKEPPRKAAAHSILPARSSEASSVCQTVSHTPNCDHSSNRRQQVVGEPYSLGKSAHAMPVFQNI